MRIDLNEPGVGFTTTPHSGPLETTAQTTSQFLRSAGAQVAVNANFFGPCCRAAAEPKDLLGLAVSEGSVVSPYVAGDFNASLLLTQTNQATITTISGPQPDAFNAVTGSGMIVDRGVNVGLVIFLVGLIADQVALKRIGAPLMGVALLFALAILADRLRSSSLAAADG